MSLDIDHFVWVVPSLEAGLDELQSLLGASLRAGGSHSGTETQNAIASLGPRIYLEVLAPTAALASPTSLGTRIKKLGVQGLYHWAVRTGGLEPVGECLDRRGVGHSGILELSRTTPGGKVLRWRMLLPDSRQFGAGLPFFIDWGSCPHPAGDAATGGLCYRDFCVVTPEWHALAAVLRELSVDVRVECGSPRQLRLTIDTPGGPATLGSPTSFDRGIQLASSS